MPIQPPRRSQIRSTVLPTFLSIAGLVVAWAFADPVLAAQSPFGVGIQDQTGAGILPWIGQAQQEFYQNLTASLKRMREDGSAFWWLVGLSFAYGIVHAAGPGHGKIVISSYVVANEKSAKAGIIISFLAAMLQASVAVAIVGIAAILLNATSFAMTGAARMFELGSYGLIIVLGLFLLFRKSRALAGLFAGRLPLGTGDHDHGTGAHACHHTHTPDPRTVGGIKSLAGAAAAIASVGIRPCSGALIVLVFAFAQGLFWAGIASAYLMGLGTALTVALLASLALGAKSLALRLTKSDGERAATVMICVEWIGALAITTLGLILMGGALSV